MDVRLRLSHVIIRERKAAHRLPAGEADLILLAPGFVPGEDELTYFSVPLPKLFTMCRT